MYDVIYECFFAGHSAPSASDYIPYGDANGEEGYYDEYGAEWQEEGWYQDEYGEWYQVCNIGFCQNCHCLFFGGY